MPKRHETVMVSCYSPAMPQFTDILKQKQERDPNIYKQVQRTLSDIESRGYNGTYNSGVHGRINVLQFPGVPADSISGLLIRIATDMMKDVTADIDPETDELQLLFPGSYSRPPVHIMGQNLAKLKSHLFNECIAADDKGPGYIVCNHSPLPFFPGAFAELFIGEGEQATRLYRLKVVDEHGVPHMNEKLVEESVFREYCHQHRDLLDTLVGSEAMPAAIVIPPQAMQRMMDALGLGPGKAMSS